MDIYAGVPRDPHEYWPARRVLCRRPYSLAFKLVLTLKTQFGTTERMPRSKSDRKKCSALRDGALGGKAIVIVGCVHPEGEWGISCNALFLRCALRGRRG